MGSATAFQFIGSINIGAGILTNPSQISMFSNLNRGFDGSGAMQVQLSGTTAGNITFDSHFVKAADGTSKFEFNATLGSAVEIDSEQQYGGCCILTINGTPSNIFISGVEAAIHPTSGLDLIWRYRADKSNNTHGNPISPAIITFRRGNV